MAGISQSLTPMDRRASFLVCLCLMLGVFPVAHSSIAFTEEPTAATVDIDQQATFSCTAKQGNDKITYTWEKDSSSVQTDSRVKILRDGTLDITKTQIGDKGSYVCVATVDGKGDTAKSNAAKLNVRYLCPSPAVSSKPDGIKEYDTGDTITLRCKCRDSFPKPQYKWTKNNAQIQFNSRITQNENKIVITKADYVDTGDYLCEATNALGTQKSSAAYTVTVGKPFIGDIRFEKDPYVVKKGRPVEIECKVSSQPKATIEWKLADGSPLPGTFSVSGCCTLQNNATSLADGGDFRCTANNSEGPKTKTVKIIVATVPKITTKPQDQILHEGQDAKLSCTVQGTPEPTVVWKKGSVDVTPGAHYALLNNSLLIKNAKASQAGVYTCRATTAGTGWYQEEKAEIQVLEKVTLAAYHQHKQDFDKGKSGEISCTFLGYQVKVKWRKQGAKELPPKIKTDSNSLSFENVDYDDEGIYICNGSNSFSSASTFVNVSVSEFPRFILTPKNTTASVEETVWLHCKATGRPQPKVTWGKWASGGGNLPEERFTFHPNGTMQIRKLQRGDEGRYFCIAAARGNTKRVSVTLRVNSDERPPEAKTQEAMGRTIGIAVGCAAAYIVLVVGLMIYCKSRRARQQNREKCAAEIPINGDIENREDGDGNDMTLNPVYRRGANYDKMDFPRHDIEALRTLGNGSYGRVFLARASGIQDGERETMVLVKALMSKDDIVREDFNKEMEMLSTMENSNVVTLLGVCKGEDPFYMIFESTEKGDLKQFLLASHENGHSKLNATQKLAMCSEVANGMNYLAAHGFVHKDLAARNCMVTKNLQIKVGFLSLSYDLYSGEYYRFNNVLIPLRWMPPEAIFHDEYSEKSDVWSYGVFMWEVYSMGEKPYHQRSDEEVLKCVKDDLRLAGPKTCPENVTEVMEKCWEGNPLARPTFTEVLNEISGISVDSHV